MSENTITLIFNADKEKDVGRQFVQWVIKEAKLVCCVSCPLLQICKRAFKNYSYSFTSLVAAGGLTRRAHEELRAQG